jgi:hypothetical protein
LSLIGLAGAAGLEPATYGFGDLHMRSFDFRLSGSNEPKQIGAIPPFSA